MTSSESVQTAPYLAPTRTMTCAWRRMSSMRLKSGLIVSLRCLIWLSKT